MKLTIMIVITLAVLVFGYLVVNNKKLDDRVYNVETFIENEKRACIFSKNN